MANTLTDNFVNKLREVCRWYDGQRIDKTRGRAQPRPVATNNSTFPARLTTEWPSYMPPRYGFEEMELDAGVWVVKDKGITGTDENVGYAIEAHGRLASAIASSSYGSIVYLSPTGKSEDDVPKYTFDGPTRLGMWQSGKDNPIVLTSIGTTLFSSHSATNLWIPATSYTGANVTVHKTFSYYDWPTLNANGYLAVYGNASQVNSACGPFYVVDMSGQILVNAAAGAVTARNFICTLRMKVRQDTWDGSSWTDGSWDYWTPSSSIIAQDCTSIPSGTLTRYTVIPTTMRHLMEVPKNKRVMIDIEAVTGTSTNIDYAKWFGSLTAMECGRFE